MPPSLSLNTNLLCKSDPVQYGIAPETIHTTQEKIQEAIQTVEAELAREELDFVNILNDEAHLSKIESVYDQLKAAKTLVVIGIGGSDLGARAIQQALESENPPQRVLFHGDSTDPVALDRLLLHLDLESSVFVIISKSGETVETISQYVYLKQLVQQVTKDWQRHFVFTTDAEKGILRQEAEKHGILTLSIPEGVGGRFSVLTSVGLLPALAMGVNIRELVTGAREFAANTQDREIAQTIASTQFQLYQQGTKVVVCMPYSVQLEEFARWFRQLWAESLGKNGKGILPIQARGPADQHSQVQFYAEGTPMQSLLFVRIEERDNPREMTQVDLEEVTYLQGHSFHEILNAEQKSTALALAKAGRPSATLSMKKLTPQSLGALFMLFELAVVYLGRMLEVNPHDQPGVEEGKLMMFSLLGREGHEAKAQEIAALEQQLAQTQQE